MKKGGAEKKAALPPTLKGCISDQEMEKIFRAKCEDFEIQYSDKLFERFLNHQAKKPFKKCFEMPSCALGAGTALLLANMIYNKRMIRVIDLSGNQIGDKGALCFADLLVATKHIISLNLCSNSIGDHGAEAIFLAMCRNKTVISLNVGSNSGVGRNSFGQKACAAMTQMLAVNKTLCELNIAMTEITADTMTVITSGLAENKTLQSLNISNNNIQSRGTIPLLGACAHTNISELYMANNHLRDDAANAFVSFLKTSKTIKVLDLTGNYFTKRFTAAIAGPLSVGCTVSSLNLTNNPLLGEGLAALGSSLYKNATLKHLYVANCQIDSQGFIEFCDLMSSNRALVTLQVAHNPILDEGAVRLSHTIRLHKTLRELDLELCDITEEGGEALFEAFARAPSLTKISVKNNLIRNGSVIQKAVIENPHIFSLNLDYNTIDYKVMVEIQRLVAENIRKWKNGQKKRVQEAVSQLSEVNHKLARTRKGITQERTEIAALEKQLNDMTTYYEKEQFEGKTRISSLQKEFEEIAGIAAKCRDECQDKIAEMRTQTGFKETQVDSLSHKANLSNEQFKAECKTLQNLEQRIRDSEYQHEQMMEGIDYRLKTTKAKYLDAKNWLIEKWKAARAAAGHSTKTHTKGRSGKKARVSDASELVSERSTSSVAKKNTKSTRTSDSVSQQTTDTSVKKTTITKPARPSDSMSQQTTDTTRATRLSDASESIETASIISADSKRSVNSKQSLVKKSAKIVKPKVKKIVPPSTPPNPGLTTQQISGEFL